MVSPIHQKYSSQSHKVFGNNSTPAMPQGPKDNNERSGSVSSMTSVPDSPTQRRRSSAANRYANLHALKRPEDEASVNRRSSLQDSYAEPGFLGGMWNKFTRGPVAAVSPPAQMKQARDTTTLRQ